MIKFSVEWIGVLAAIFELLALYLIGKKNLYGFICGIVGNVTWVTFTFLSQSAFGIFLVSISAMFLNVRGYINWRKNNDKLKNFIEE